MNFSVFTQNPVAQKTDLLVVCRSPEKAHKNTLFNEADKKFKKELSNIIKSEELKGTAGENKLVFLAASARYVLIVGLGEAKKFSLETIRNMGAAVYGVAKQIKAKKVVCEIGGREFKKFNIGELTQALVEGATLASYKFERYVKATPAVKFDFALVASTKEVTEIKRAALKAATVSRGVMLARDLVNTPASDMTPKHLADAAKKLKGVSVKIHNLAAIKKMQMGSFLSVARGSTENPPYFIEMHYRPKGKAKKKIALIGKGVTFDTGGYSIKPAKGMETMKDDMAAAAALIGLMSVIKELAPKVEVSGYIAATENMVSGFAQKPGDVCRAMNGKTIEVLNTDAEGRLTLADAMCYANKRKPDVMIDMATLTGACLVALGLRVTGAMGNDDDLIKKIIDCGKHEGEMVWQLPLVEEYREELKSPIADLKNIGGGYAGTITAALFLQEFVGTTKWVHLDIAGPSFTEKPFPYIQRGGTGVMVKTLARFLETQ